MANGSRASYSDTFEHAFDAKGRIPVPAAVEEPGEDRPPSFEDRLNAKFEAFEARGDAKFASLEAKFDSKIELLRRDMTIKLGGMLVIAVGVILAAMRFMPHP